MASLGVGDRQRSVHGQEQLAGALVAGYASKPPALPLPRGVLIAGAGRAAEACDLLCALVRGHSTVPVERLEGPLPAWASGRALVVCVSDEDEPAVPAVLAEARRRGVRTLAVGVAGGLLERTAGGLDVVLPAPADGIAALGRPFGAAARVLEAAGVVAPGLVARCVRGASAPPEGGEALGSRLAGVVPVIYGAGPLAAVARTWRAELAREAGVAAFSHSVPEVAHNEIVGWEGAPDGRFAAVLLRAVPEPPRLACRLDAIAEIIASDALFVETVRAPGARLAERVFALVAHGSAVSAAAAAARRGQQAHAGDVPDVVWAPRLAAAES